MGLKEYQRKRKFERTPEPKGGKAKPSKDLRFVVHMHAASRLHFDLRLEMDGVFKSWAVPKRPSLNPMDQRLAVFVEDHPIEYGSFEGVIPEGNYGAGTVVLWDAGTYVERGSTGRTDSNKAMLAGLSKGHITFVMNGSKLQGEFALIKLKKDPKAWLLVKKRDAASTFKTTPLPDQSVLSGRTVDEVREYATEKGITWKSKKNKAVAIPPPAPAKDQKQASKVRPPAPFKLESRLTPSKTPSKGEMPRRVKPMLAVEAGAPEGKDWIFSEFGGGVRAIAEVEDGSAKIHTRQLLPLQSKYPEIVSALESVEHSLVLDGEIEGEKKQAVFRVLDLLYIDGKDLREAPLRQRLHALAKLKLPAPLHAATLLDAAPEGCWISRQADSAYKSGTSKDWLRSSLKAPKQKKNKSAKSTPSEDDFSFLSHPDKVFWPKEKITKGDLVEYYRSISQYILPHLRDRPQSLHRQPDGITKPGFFHKDITGYLPRGIESTRVYSASSQRTINYLLCQNERSLLYMANLGCIELNPWLSRIPNLEFPDYCVIDLDPDTNSFNEVIRVAQEVHRILDKIKAPHGVKTSGASGIHIFVPLPPKTDYETSRGFALEVARQVHEKFPRFTSLERSPAKRRGKIYLDCFQNGRGQTVASIYCVRPQAGATVSTPLHWREVKAGLKPSQFTIYTVPARLKKQGDLWAKLLNSPADLAACLRRLSS